MSNPRPTIRDK